jgi:hypothetical protein
MNRDSVIGIATSYGLDDRGVRSSGLGGVINFLYHTSSRPAVGSIQPPIQWVPGTLSPRVTRPWRKADNLPPAIAEVKKIWIYISTPPYAFMV